MQNFSAKDADIKVQNNSLLVSSINPYFEIIYNTPFNIKANPIFDYKFFIIIAVLSYLLAYKLTSYLADFKNVKHQSRIEIVFLSIFALILIIPASAINNEKYSEQENRKLAEKPKLIDDNEINYNFGKEFDAWFSDRFNLRGKIIKGYNKLKDALAYNLYNIRGQYYYSKKTLWVFNSRLRSSFNSKTKPIYYRNIKKLNDFCKKHNIKLYIIFSPIKADIYEQFAPWRTNYKKQIMLVNYINNKIGHNVAVYPREEMIQAAKNDYVFPKGDEHWTEYGTFTAYKVLMNNIKKDFTDVKILDDNDFIITKNRLARTDYGNEYNKGFEYKILNINKLTAQYTTYQYKQENSLLITCNDQLLSCDSSFPYGNNKKVYIIGNSFSENLFLFLKYTFSDIKKRRINNLTETPKCKMSRWEKEILDFKPDILIFVITEADGHMRAFSELYGEDE